MNSSAGSSANVTRSNKTNQNIQVYVRVRPLNAREKGIRSVEVVDVVPPKEIIARQFPESKMTKKFTFDRTFGPDSNQSEVYQTVVAPLIEEVLSGYNCTVFAYGQTGTGKTHTMIGTECPELKSSWDDNSMIGIIPRALSHLFDELRMMELEFSMRISYLELYNEELCDLLSSDDSVKIRIFDDANKKGSVIVQGLEEIPVHSKDDVYKLLEKGQERRKTATTLMNAQSSRSHTVFSIIVHIKENGIDGEEMLKLGKLNLVDLAGSENISKSGNEKGIRSRETVNINQSLLTLGRVITALVERTPHIPYRESKLTRLLQESLGGRTKTSIIATISPGHKDLEETLSTLEYAHRAKNIQNKPEVNQKLTKKTVLKEYTEEIDKLKRDLMAARDKNGIYLAEETYNDMQYKLDSQNRELTEKVLLVKALKEELASKERLFNETSLNLVEKTVELREKDKNLQETQSELNQTKRVLTNTKKRYKEKRVLLDNHIKTEKELTSQAIKLIEVADIVTKDTIHLHGSLERRKDLESKNQTALQQLSGKMKDTFEMMNENLESLKKEHDTHSKLLIQDVSKSQRIVKAFSSKAAGKINSILKNQKTSTETISSYVEKYSTELDEVFVIHKTNFNSMIQELEKNQEEKRTNLEGDLTEIVDIIQKQNILLSNTYENLSELTDANRNIHKKYLTETQEKLQTIAKMVTDKLEEKKNHQTESIEKKKLISKERQNLLDNFTDLMEKMKDLQNQDSKEIENLMEISEIDSIVEPFTKDMNDEMKSVESFVNQIGNESEEQIKILNNFKDEMNTMSENCLESIDKADKIVKDDLNESKDKMKEVLESIEKYEDKIKNIGEVYKKDVNTKKEEANQQMETEIKQSLEIINEECNRLDQHHTTNNAITTSLKNCVKDFTTGHQQHISDCHTHMENFQTSELKTYSPTGLTPSKREFSYPRILAATSPHNLIIKRFRLENDMSSDLDASITIIEDSEPTPSEISNSFVINSTPIKSEEEMKQFQPLAIENTQNTLNIPQNLQNIKPNTSALSLPSSRKNSPVLIFNEENKENNSC